jgi:beta-xylosidase
MKRILPFLLMLMVCFSACKSGKVKITNPIVDGYYADPSIIYDKGVYYIYATKDPWGGNDLAVLETSDFIHFTSHKINWPTKSACMSPSSNENKVWAPSVVKGKDRKFYMYVSVGSEIWAGIGDSPLGPWRNIKQDQTPLINRNYFRGYHMIDAEAFIDDDGQAYLYWGSGLNWVNGACFAVKLNKHMDSFIGKPKNITPPEYFEAPFMLKRNGIYYLMYSNGKAINGTYNVRYSIGKTPFGPWEEGKNSPILSTTADSSVIGPGHNTVFKKNGQYYILYHKVFPQGKKYVLRQLCLDSLNFDSDQNIEKIRHNGVIL